MKPINAFHSRKQSGASAIEYAIIASVIALVILGAASLLDLDTAFLDFLTAIQDAIKVPSSGSGSGSGD